MLYYSEIARQGCIDESRFKSILTDVLNKIESERKIEKVLVLPPDFTRFHSRSGEITQAMYAVLDKRLRAVMPALGTHYAMNDEEKSVMFQGIPSSLIMDHDHQNDVVELGRISREEVSAVSNGAVDYDWPVQVNKILLDDWDLIVSIGQVVPHEVAGMANYTKNILV